MAEDSVYTNDEVVAMSKEIANDIINTESSIRSYMYDSDAWKKGPIAMFNEWSDSCNPKGKYPVSIELLTYKQKATIAEIVGNAMVEVNKPKK